MHIVVFKHAGSVIDVIVGNDLAELQAEIKIMKQRYPMVVTTVTDLKNQTPEGNAVDIETIEENQRKSGRQKKNEGE